MSAGGSSPERAGGSPLERAGDSFPVPAGGPAPLPAWLYPVLDADEMRALDRWAIEEMKVPSLDLMEAAGRALADAVIELAVPGPVRIVCGKGNNGGDGLVAARLLAERGLDVETILLAPPTELSPDAAANHARLGPAGADAAAGFRVATEAADLDQALAGVAIVVDAVLGTGFAGEPRGSAAEAIAAINRSGAVVVAADIASGVDASTGEVGAGDEAADAAAVAADAAVRANLTVTFHRPKLGHYIHPGKSHSGDLRIAPIGIPPAAPPAEPAARPGDAADDAATPDVGAVSGAGAINSGVLRLLPSRGALSTKFSSGQVGVVGGSPGLTGAVCLVAEAAIRAGAGYATVVVPATLEAIFETKLTEVMSVGCTDREGRLGPD
ncbi:MAG TPA: NAD(P)H-hydrate epimerase, partial [Solirubrobacterales bacterium]|nr:NAD(P)H-hydrate epimerase [Solirubrobacterales bacterium]